MTDPTTAPEPLVSYYSAANAPEPAGAATLTAFMEAVTSNENKRTVERLRERLAANDEEGYAKAKRSLAAVSLSGKTTTGGRAKSHEQDRFVHSGYMQIDFDGKDNIGWTVTEMRDILQADPRVVAAFVSPSGDGVKGVARIQPNVASHLASFIAVREFFAQHNLTVDESCKDPGRLCFVSWDPDGWIDLERTEIFEPAAQLDFDQGGAPTKGLVLRMRQDAFPSPPMSGIHSWLMHAAWWCRINDMTEPQTAAKLQGYDGTLRRRLQPTEAVDASRKVFAVARDNTWKISADVAARIGPSSTSTLYIPEDVFYDAPAGKYLIKVGNTYHQQSKRSPVITGLTRHLAKSISDPKELAASVRATINARELDGGIQWSGSIAGHRQGLTNDIDDKPMLILSEAKLPVPVPGDCPTITDLLSQAFAEPIAMQVFISWLAGRYRAVRDHTHIPSPMLVMAGEVNSGKSLLAWIASQCLGGRSANPYSAWSGGILWNDDIIASEMLLVDDCAGTIGMAARRGFGASFKEAMYPHLVQMRKRNNSSVSVRPVWACIVCCNNTPEALQIIPPLDADMSDKVILLHVSPVTLPVDTSTPAGRVTMQAMIRNDLPAFIAELTDWETPPELHDSRSGIAAWRDPDLLNSVDAESPARRLEVLLEVAVEDRGIWYDLPREMAAIEIETRMTDPKSSVREQARSLLHWHGACGAALSRLAKMGRSMVTEGVLNSHDKTKRFYITGEKSTK
jgi:hypothetical protein